MRLIATLATILVVLAALPAEAQSSAENAWWAYVERLENPNLMDLRDYYSEAFLADIGDDRVSHGRAKLGRHRNVTYALVALDYGHNVVDVEETGNRAILTLAFTSRTDPQDQFTDKAELVYEGGEWLVDRTPRGPSFLKLDESRIKLIALVGLVALVAFALYKKLLG